MLSHVLAIDVNQNSNFHNFWYEHSESGLWPLVWVSYWPAVWIVHSTTHRRLSFYHERTSYLLQLLKMVIPIHTLTCQQEDNIHWLYYIMIINMTYQRTIGEYRVFLLCQDGLRPRLLSNRHPQHLDNSAMIQHSEGRFCVPHIETLCIPLDTDLKTINA